MQWKCNKENQEWTDEAEERICETEDGNFEIIQSEEDKGKRMKE